MRTARATAAKGERIFRSTVGANPCVRVFGRLDRHRLGVPTGNDRDEAVGRHRHGRALRYHGVDRRHGHPVCHHPVRGLADQDLHRRRRLLQLVRQPNHVSDQDVFAGAGSGNRDLAGRNPGPVDEPHTPAAGELLIEDAKGNLSLGSGSDGS